MEHNTDRVLWPVLILVIGVALYIGFRPAVNGLLGQGIEKIQTVVDGIHGDTNDSSSSNNDIRPNLMINTSSSSTNGPTKLQGASNVNICGSYSRTDSYEQIQATDPSARELFYRPMVPLPDTLNGLIPGETYTLSGSASHTSGELMFRAQYGIKNNWIYYNNTFSPIIDLGIPVSDGSVFTPFSYTFTVPANATGVYISLQNYDYTAGSLFRFKDMKLVKD